MQEGPTFRVVCLASHMLRLGIKIPPNGRKAQTQRASRMTVLQLAWVQGLECIGFSCFAHVKKHAQVPGKQAEETQLYGPEQHAIVSW